MWNSLFHPSISVLELVVRVLGVYFFILFLMRVSGKRQMGQLSPIEFVTMLLISNAVQNSMNGGDNSLLGGLILALVMIAVSYLIAVLGYKFVPFRHLVEGRPTILIRKGELQKGNMKRELITREELITMLRRQGIHHCKDVEIAIMESDGSLSVTPVANLSSVSSVPTPGTSA